MYIVEAIDHFASTIGKLLYMVPITERGEHLFFARISIEVHPRSVLSMKMAVIDRKGKHNVMEIYYEWKSKSDGGGDYGDGGGGPYADTDLCQDVGLWLEEINLGSYRQIFKEIGVNGEYLESMSMFTIEQILRFIRRCHMKWGDFITLYKELRRIKVACLKGEQRVRRTWWAPPCLVVVFVKSAKSNRQARVVLLKLEP
ncbi:uncharacterized protein LOC124924395 [Impatiens glandulifera]|uniref:uncharacterized protein LOC124924395 n=1 Tax=Impatiens glandulifera TaxID=253017 RepID=UPI001FB17387|nr:uncharacterized protein LOC124924395 [Impatiens glandulifera]